MANLYLFKYNNYFNRLLKRKESIAGYGIPLFVLQDTNFNPNDGVNAVHVVNYDFSKISPDYAVVTENGQIRNRWYVMECRRVRAGQYRLDLLRDVMADYRSELLNSTAFIEKGYVPSSSPLIFNNENMGFNQVKTAEYLLKNNLGTPWIVLYLSRYNGEGVLNTFSGEFDDEPSTIQTDYTLDQLSDYKYNYYSTRRYWAFNDTELYFETIYQNDYNTVTSGKCKKMDRYLYDFTYGKNSSLPKNSYPIIPDDKILDVPGQGFQDMFSVLNTGYSVVGGLPVNSYLKVGIEDDLFVGNISGYNTLKNENGKTIKVGDEIYRIEIQDTDTPEPSSGFIESEIKKDSILGAEMREYFFNQNDISVSGRNELYKVLFPTSYPCIKVNYVNIGSATKKSPISYNITYDKSITRDASYEIIAAPLNDITFDEVPGISGVFRHNGDFALLWFQQIINKYHGSNFAYDIQIVPYCPVDTSYLGTQIIDFCERNGAKLALAIRLQKSSFSSLLSISDVKYREDTKKSNELDLYRLVSPNGVGEYEWGPAKNRSKPYNFEVDCTLIPFGPYIKINPYYSGLYGSDFNDYRGLICGGDFSLPIVSSEWETYKLNNKYYQDIFDRDIAHQEFNNKYANMSDIFSGITGALSGASAAGAAGGLAGGLTGAAIGGTAGGIASAAGGIADIFINRKIREENIQYQKDRFGYELGTIKARAQSLTRGTSFNVNNKYFPYLEYWTCTETEEEAFENKILYNGMNVGVIGKLEDYLNKFAPFTYVQGEIIEIDIPDDYHIAETINNILKGGIRIA